MLKLLLQKILKIVLCTSVNDILLWKCVFQLIYVKDRCSILIIQLFVSRHLNITNFWQKNVFRDLLSKKHTRKHIFAITFSMCYEIFFSAFYRNQSKQIIIIIIRQKRGKTYMEKFEIFFVNLDVCLSFSNVTLSISSKTFSWNLKWCTLVINII